MALKKEHHTSSARRTRQPLLLSLLCFSLYGFLILFFLSLFFWAKKNFLISYLWVQQLWETLNFLMPWPLFNTPKDIFFFSEKSIVMESYSAVYQLFLLVKIEGQILLMKLFLLITALPLLLISSVAGLIDGLNQRAVRTACLGRESTYLFHKSLPFAKKCLKSVLAIWLCVPIVFKPSPLFVAFALMLALVVSVSASRFKKYV